MVVIITQSQQKFKSATKNIEKEETKQEAIDIQHLKLNEEIRMKCAVEVSNRFQALAEVEDLDEQWKITTERITTAAEKE